MHLIKVHSKMCDTTNVDILYVHDFASWAPKNTSISSALKHSKVMTSQYLHARFQNHVSCATWFWYVYGICWFCFRDMFFAWNVFLHGCRIFIAFIVCQEHVWFCQFEASQAFSLDLIAWLCFFLACFMFLAFKFGAFINSLFDFIPVWLQSSSTWVLGYKLQSCVLYYCRKIDVFWGKRNTHIITIDYVLKNNVLPILLTKSYLG